MKKTVILVTILAAFALLIPASAQSEELSEVKISATIRTYVLTAPRFNAELARTFEAGAEESAFGRDEDGSWLRIMDGWVLAEVFNTEGEIGALPDTTASFLAVTAVNKYYYDGPSKRWFNNLGRINLGTSLLVIGRNEDSTWFKLPAGWIEEADITTDGDVSLLPVTPSGVIITAKTRTFILKEADLSAEFVDVFEAGQEALAIGRAGDWLQMAQGWVAADAVEFSATLDDLPYAGDGILIELKYDRTIQRLSSENGTKVGELRKGESVWAVGRNLTGSKLELGNGWINVGLPYLHGAIFTTSGDIMTLPITDGSGSTTSSSTSIRPTPTPRPSTALTSRALRSLIARHTDDIRILDIQTAASATTIEYDLKPWPFVPNETIADEVAFKIICAIRNGQPIPNALKFIGHTHFKSEVGRKFTGPSVEMQISSRNANRIVCRGNDPSDINWRSLASRYKSFPIPRGASIDYD